MSSPDFGLSLSGLQILWLPVRRAHWLQAQRSCGVSMNGVGWGQLWALTCDFRPCLSSAVCCCSNRVPEVEGFTVKTNLFLTVTEAKSKTKRPESLVRSVCFIQQRTVEGRVEGRGGERVETKQSPRLLSLALIKPLYPEHPTAPLQLD